MSAHTPTLKPSSTSPGPCSKESGESPSTPSLKSALRSASYAEGCDLLRPIQMKESGDDAPGSANVQQAGWSFVTGQRAGPVAHRATVYFPDRGVAVVGDGQNILKEVADAYSADAGSQRVLSGVVHGSADALPSVAPSNIELAQERAQNTRDAVVSAFLGIGFQPSQLSLAAAGFGDADSARDPRCAKKIPEALAEYRRAKVLIWESPPPARHETQIGDDGPPSEKTDDSPPSTPSAKRPVPKPRAIGRTENMDAGVAAIRAGRHDHARQLAAAYINGLIQSGSSYAWLAETRLGIKIAPTAPPTWSARMASIEVPHNARAWQVSALRMDVAYREWVYWDEKVLSAGGSWARAEKHPTDENKQILATEAGYMFFASEQAEELALSIIRDGD